MKKKYTHWGAILAIVALVFVLSACGERKQFVNDAQLKHYPKQETSLSVRPTSGASEAKIRELTASAYTNTKTNIALLVDEGRLDGESSSSKAKIIFDYHSGKTYTSLDELMDTMAASSDITQPFEGKYLTGSIHQLTKAEDSTADEIGIATFDVLFANPKLQKNWLKDLNQILSNTKNDKFKKSGQHLTYTYSHAQVRKIAKQMNHQIKNENSISDLALSDSELSDFNDKLDDYQITQTVYDNRRKTSFKIKTSDSTYHVTLSTAKSQRSVETPEWTDTMTRSEFQDKMERAMEDVYDDMLGSYLEDYFNQSGSSDEDYFGYGDSSDSSSDSSSDKDANSDDFDVSSLTYHLNPMTHQNLSERSVN